MDDETTPAAAPTTLLGNLRAKRQELVADQTLDLQVPGWSNPEIWVRYRPASHPEVRGPLQRIEKMPAKEKGEAEFNANIDLLVNTCLAVYATIDGKQYSLRPGQPDGELTKFDEALAENLGVTPATARATARALFLKDGDIVSHASSLIRWSGYVDEATEAEYRKG